jgi:hypothetical protein
MMGSVKDDFSVEDEPLDEVRRAWDSGERVLVIPSSFRRRLRRHAGRLRQLLGHGFALERRQREI